MSRDRAYIVAARRTAVGRLGGLHRSRRLPDLAAPVIAACLGDAKLAPGAVEAMILGNSLEGGNVARLIALSAGFADTSNALTIDRHRASGLDAILLAAQMISVGDAEIVVAGGAESASTAPWRIARPRAIEHQPHFLSPGAFDNGEGDSALEALEEIAVGAGISRAAQDAAALKSHARASAARAAKRFVGEIVPLRGNAEEARDESAVEPAIEDLMALTPFLPPEGTLTPGNTSALHDGAAFVLVVSEAVWNRIGRPPHLKVRASLARGADPGGAFASTAALATLFERTSDIKPADIAQLELSETTALEMLLLGDALGIPESRINPDGGSLARGDARAAESAIAVVRLFSGLVRQKAKRVSTFGVVAVSAAGGLGTAAIFEASET